MPTEICDRLGADVPVFAFSHCRDVVAAVTRAGGVGVLGGTSMSAEDLELDLQWLDAECAGKPYGVDLLFPIKSAGNDLSALDADIPSEHRTYTAQLAEEFGIPPRNNPDERSRLGGAPTELDHLPTNALAEELWEVAQQHDIRLLASALGPPPAEVARTAKKMDATLAGLVGAPKHVQRHLDVGVDMIVAQGNEAAGHTGIISTMVLVPQIVAAAGDVPVIAAGGIATGAQLAACLALGAQGAWTGSLWLATAESDLDPIVKEKVVAASSVDTFITRSLTGKTTRQLRTDWLEAWDRPEAPEPLGSPSQQLLVKDPIISAFEHHIAPVMGTTCGQAAGLVTRQRTVQSVMEEMMMDFVETLQRLGSLAEL
jgi:NAD(P)H-dependent flavin oxidoreductase YrpB (nitropropane dioxygenase family)